MRCAGGYRHGECGAEVRHISASLDLAREIIEAQTEEIGAFQAILAKDYGTPMNFIAAGGR